MDNLSRPTQQKRYEQEIKNIFEKREKESIEIIPKHLRDQKMINERVMPTITFAQKQAHTYQTSPPSLPEVPMNPSANSTEVKEYTAPLSPPSCDPNPLERVLHLLKDMDEKHVVWGAMILPMFLLL